ncbi:MULTISPECIES: hypothetical protein [Rhodomicrobium]|uniref:hypothetical protein n=1 Tax=Rhodomicrobium TaxID=1068 RepID=UPI000F7416EE|nr:MULTISPECIES: hypothetical protein [Rhodomicrobium]
MANNEVRRIVTGTDNPVANSATLIAEIISSPGKPFVISTDGPRQTEAPVDLADPNLGRRSAKIIEVGSTYQFILITVIIITVLTIPIYGYAVYKFPAPTEAQKNFMTLLDFLAKTGFGTIVGLLGGKSL